MPFSFIDIEVKKTRSIFVFFFVLIAFYFLVAWLIAIPFKLVFLINFREMVKAGEFSLLPSFKQSMLALIIATIAGIAHWHVSTNRLISKVMNALNARPLDPEDVFHQRFRRVVEEAAVAAGGMKIQCCVLPTTALNAFALADLSGTYVIGVTEGLIARLSRSQLESVVGHELAHLVNGDSLMATVVTALFGVYATMMKGIEHLLGANRRSQVRISGRGGAMIAFLMLVYAILGLSRLLSTMLNMFISRQRELRADAVAVRLTRNPLALAEALHVISRGWRGAHLPAEHLGTIFIINPAMSRLDEREGLLANLFSTHPPVSRRLNVLLGMAHSSVAQMREGVRQRDKLRQQRSDTVQEIKKMPLQWFAVGPDAEWQGPYGIEQLQKIPWFTAETWVRKSANARIRYASQEKEIQDMFRGRVKAANGKACPRCAVAMADIMYEGAPLLRCNSCGGVMLKQGKIPRILARCQQGFSPEVEQLAGVIKQKRYDRDLQRKNLRFKSVFELPCPQCRKKMQRKLYNYIYPVEIDFCPVCDIIWFDKNELDLLQCLYEDEHYRRGSKQD